MSKTIEYWHPKRGNGPALEDSIHAHPYTLREKIVNSKVLDVRWFSGRDCVGIVRCEVPYEGIKYYIGVSTEFDSDVSAARNIADWGARFPDELGDILFGVEK